MKAQFWILITVLSIGLIFSVPFTIIASKDLVKSISIGNTLMSYNSELQKVRVDNSFNSSNGYIFNPGGKEIYEEKYKEISVKRDLIFNSDDSFTKYFSNLNRFNKFEFVVSKVIAIIFYLFIFFSSISMWIWYLIQVNKKSKKAKAAVKSRQKQIKSKH